MHACLYYSSVNPIWCGFIITFARCFFAHFAVYRFLEQCAMIVSCTISVQTFFRRTSICEIVECYRSPKPCTDRGRVAGRRLVVSEGVRGRGGDREEEAYRASRHLRRTQSGPPAGAGLAAKLGRQPDTRGAQRGGRARRRSVARDRCCVRPLAARWGALSGGRRPKR